MKAIKKPIPIDVEEFQPMRLPWPVNVTLNSTQPLGYEVFNKLHGSWIGVKPGDYVNVSNPDDSYPIDRATFERTYDIIGD